MKKTFTIKHALYLNVIALLTSFAMLLSCTYAWFTDTVTSGVNRIEAGRFRVEAYHQTWVNGAPAGEANESDKIEDKTDLFNEALNNTNGNNGTALQLWEPGAMAVETFTVKNEGELALKYQFNLVAAAFNQVTWSQDSTDGKYDLRDVIKVAVVEDNPSTTKNELTDFDSRDDFTALSSDSWMTWSEFVSGANKTGRLYPKDSTEGSSSEEFIVAMYWPSTANDNYYNLYARGLGNATLTNYPALYSSASDRLFIDVKTVINATQDTVEADSFGITYDDLAENPNATALSTSAAAAVSASSAPVAIAFNENSTTTTSEGGEKTLTAKVGNTPVATAKVAAETALTLTKLDDYGNPTDTMKTSLEENETVDLQLSVESTEDTGTLVIATGNGSKSYDVDMTAIVTTTTNPGTDQQASTKAEYKVASTEKVFIVDLYIGTVDLQGFYHNSKPMTKVSSSLEVDEDGEYFYDSTPSSETYGCVTFATTSFSPFTAEYKYAGGIGTEEEHPYLIETADQWYKFVHDFYIEYPNDNSKYADAEVEGVHVAIINDIDMAGYDMSSWTDNPTSITIDGRNHTISNLNGGLFGKDSCWYGTCAVSNLKLKNVTAKYSALGYGWDGKSNPHLTLTNVDLDTVSATQGSYFWYLGSATVTFDGCDVVNGNVTGGSFGTGGFVGNGQNSTINNCSFHGNVTSTDQAVGGFFGQGSANMVITNSEIKSGTVLRNIKENGTVYAYDNQGGGNNSVSSNNKCYAVLNCDKENNAYKQGSNATWQALSVLKSSDFTLAEDGTITYSGDASGIAKITISESMFQRGKYFKNAADSGQNTHWLGGYSNYWESLITVNSNQFESVTDGTKIYQVTRVTNLVNYVNAEYANQIACATSSDPNVEWTEYDSYLDRETGVLYFNGYSTNTNTCWWMGDVATVASNGSIAAKIAPYGDVNIRFKVYDSSDALLGSATISYRVNFTSTTANS